MLACWRSIKVIANISIRSDDKESNMHHVDTREAPSSISTFLSKVSSTAEEMRIVLPSRRGTNLILQLLLDSRVIESIPTPFVQDSPRFTG